MIPTSQTVEASPTTAVRTIQAEHAVKPRENCCALTAVRADVSMQQAGKRINRQEDRNGHEGKTEQARVRKGPAQGCVPTKLRSNDSCTAWMWA